VGWKLKEKAGKKKVILELGGNAACIIDEGADIEDAIPRVIKGAYYQSGQSCISVQRILVHESVADEFEAKLLKATRELTSGDPKEEETFIGPMISESEAERVMEWIEEARDAGAEVLCAGGVLINEVPSWRVDNMPYGGIKDSGLGREGLKYAIEDMTEIRTLVIRDA
jgi:acyl-CoA reductase-like NAD-dependent aldehyde dehydrogenase